MTDYAMYKGDHFIDLGTLTYLAEKYHKTESALKSLSYPSAHKKAMEIVYCYMKLKMMSKMKTMSRMTLIKEMSRQRSSI